MEDFFYQRAPSISLGLRPLVITPSPLRATEQRRARACGEARGREAGRFVRVLVGVRRGMRLLMNRG